MSDFWRYAIVKQIRKFVWKGVAAVKRATADPHAPPPIGPTAYGVRMVERWADRTYVYCRGGTYGRFLADVLEHRSRPFAFIDIGANQGLYSLIAARNPACTKIIAFEPVQSTYELLLANAAANQSAEKIVAHRLAVSTRTGPISIRIPVEHSGMAAIGDSGDLKGPVRLETIEAVAATELENILAGSEPLIVKVDVEGHEAEVFAELLNTRAATRIQSIFYEVDLRWSDDQRIETMLRRAGFHRFSRVGFGRHFDVLAERA